MPAAPEGIVDALQSSLRLHWAAIEAYTAQSKHYEVWGYKKLAEKYAADAEEERGHAAKLMERLEFYNTAPDVDHDPVAWPRHDFVGTLDANYGIETEAAAVERDGWTLALDSGDSETASVFAALRADSDASIIEIEATREVIGMIGLDNYLANLT